MELGTLVLAMPVSYEGTLQQCAGRLQREHASKTDVRIAEFVNTGQPALQRMRDKGSAAVGRWDTGSSRGSLLLSFSFEQTRGGAHPFSHAR